MCTSIILIRKNHKWPIIFASNRDEKFSRKSLPPKNHWKNNKNIYGGFDKKKKGTWLGINKEGIFACIHNNNSNILKKKDYKTRGKIILKVLEYNKISLCINQIKSMNKSLYDGFNLVLADKKKAYFIRHFPNKKKLLIKKIPDGYSIITNNDINNFDDKKIKKYYNLFKKSNIPNPDKNDWSSWINILESKDDNKLKYPEESIFFNINNVFGTVSSSFIFLSKSNNNIYLHGKRYKNKFIYKEINLL